MLIVYAPAIQQHTSVVPIPPIVESRTKVPLPDGNPVLGLWSGNGYFPAYERHFNDVFGFRDFFIRLRNQIQFSLFGDSNQVVVGRDGWLADKSTLEVEQPAVDALTDLQFGRLGDRILHLRRILARKGVYLLVVPVPLKNTVYPDKFPAYAARRPALTGYARFLRLLGDNNIPYVDAYDVLVAARRRVNVYYRTDLHWNTVGAREVAAETIRMLAIAEHSKVRWKYADQYTFHSFAGGGDNDVLATFWQVPDDEPFEASHIGDCGTPVMDPGGTVEHFTNDCHGSSLPAATFFGNSFSIQMMNDGFENHFSKLYRVHDLTHFNQVISYVQPGSHILIWQLFELEIGYQMQSDDWWREVDEAP